MSQPQNNHILDQLSQHSREQLLELQREQAARQLEPLKLYKPHDYQKPVHECPANEVIVLGGNRCLAGDQELYDPVLGVSRRIEDIDGDFHVFSLNPAGLVEIKRAEKPFIKAYDDLYEVTLSTGECFRCTLNHRVVDADGRWVSVRDAWQRQAPLYRSGDERLHRHSLASGGRSPRLVQAQPPSASASLSGTSLQAVPARASAFRPRPDCGRALLSASVSEIAGGGVRQPPPPLPEGSGTPCRLPLPPASSHPLPFGRHESHFECWLSLAQSTVGTCLSGFAQDVLHLIGTVASWTASCLSDRCRGGERLLCCEAAFQGPPPLRVDAHGHTRLRWRRGGQAGIEVCSRPCLWSRHPSSLGAAFRSAGRIALSLFPCASRHSECNAVQLPLMRQSLGSISSDPRTSTAPFADQSQFDASHPPRFTTHGLNTATITRIEYMRTDAVWDTFVAGNNNYWMSGLFHAQSGKTLCSAMEFAWAVTGTHPVKDRYPKENGNAAIVCSGWRHVGMVLAPLLLKAGAFSVIRDEQTGAWRAYDPVNDRPRRAEIKPAPPLIPPRLIEQQSWLLKAANQIQTLTLTNGWNIQFYSSEGDPFQGIAMDLIWVDEDITNDGNWLSEMQARLGDRKGRLIWSAMPHSKNDALLGLSDRADQAAALGQTHISKFVFRFLDNPAIEDEEKRKMVERWAALGSDTLRMRAEGEFTFDSLLVYPTFTMSIHGMERKELPNESVPMQWTRYAVVDPGHAVTAVLFAAVPPSGDFCLIYDELYIRNCNALIFGDRLAESIGSQQFYAFLIDAHGARLTDIGSGRSPQDQYTERMSELGVKSQMTGSSFIPGCDDIQAGLSSVRSAMHIRSNGTPFLRVLKGACPNLEREMKRYKKKAVNVGGQTIVTDEPVKKGEFHLVDCLRYLMAYEPRYHKIEAVTEKPWWWETVKRRERERNKGGVVYLAPESYTATEVYYA